MPSPENKGTSATRAKPFVVANEPAIRRASPPPSPNTRRGIRIARREMERRRRIRWLAGFAAVIIIIAAVVFHPWDHFSLGATAAKTSTASAACAPTPTVVGPLPAQTPPATPPPTSNAAVSDQGIQYIDIKVGCGSPIKAGDSATVTYNGWLQSNGQLFDSSLNHSPGTFQVTNIGQAQVIQGWNIGLQGMRVGGTRRLIIPAALGYGAQAAGSIPPNSTLVFDVSIVSIP